MLYLLVVIFFSSTGTVEVKEYRVKTSKDMISEVQEGRASIDKPAYFIPDLKTEQNFTYRIYIDPDYCGGGSNGTIEKPYTSVNNTFKDGIPANTAFLIKRGTTLNEKIGRLGKNQYDMVLSRMVYNNNFFGAYGQGEKPVVRGFFIMPPSKDLTICDLHIYGESQRGTGWDALIYTHRISGVSRQQNITIAYNIIEGKPGSGYWDPAPYPLKGIRIDCDNLVVFNNEIKKIFVDGIWVMGGVSHKYIRNWIHDINYHAYRAITENWPTAFSNDPRSENRGGGGDGIQVNYSSQDYYVAGNLIDRHHTMWKFCAIFGGSASREYGWNSPDRNLVIEYNTFISPKEGKGGSILYFDGPKGTIIRHNLFDSTNKGTQKGVPAFAATHLEGNIRDILLQVEPFGIRHNHIIKQSENGSVTAFGNHEKIIPSSNKVFINWEEYQNYLIDNDPVGSDIDPDSFW